MKGSLHFIVCGCVPGWAGSLRSPGFRVRCSGFSVTRSARGNPVGVELHRRGWLPDTFSMQRRKGDWSCRCRLSLCGSVRVCESAFLTFGPGSCVLSAAVYTAERLFPRHLARSDDSKSNCPVASRWGVGCPLFDRPKRGRKKSHEPVRAHCVRVAGLVLLRLKRAERNEVILWTPSSETPHRERPGTVTAPQLGDRRGSPSHSIAV